MTALRQVAALVRKDLLIEWRTRDLLATVGALGLGIVVMFALAVDFTRVPFALLGAPVLWIAFTFTGMTALSRSFALERENHCFDGLLLAPADRSVLYLGKLAGNLIVLLVLDGFLLALCLTTLNVGGAVKLDGSRMLALGGIVVVNALGFAAVGTLLAVMAHATRRGDFLLPVLQSVLALPILISAVIATQRVFTMEAPLAEAWAPVRISLVFDIVFVALSLVVFDHVVEE